jgi:23S rRNA (cytidine1920-2'-O)/16S rRNA (cytidine1409-2'-O)-methyltransferase
MTDISTPQPQSRAPKERLDQALARLGFCDSRSKAQGLILAGRVRVNGQKVEKPGHWVSDPPDVITVDVAENGYVSRGGHKLAQALQEFALSVAGQVCLDAGASTGGFTDCLLQQGAAKVYAVDVGYGQLDWRLRQDERVVVMERTNIRHLPEAGGLPEKPTFACVDVSFISLLKVMPALDALLAETATMVALLKPQFEFLDLVPPEKRGKHFKGVVTDPEHHRQIVTGVCERLQQLFPAWQILGITVSPILGPKGNREFLLGLRKSGPPEGAFLPHPPAINWDYLLRPL